jgi:hypothetical protein
MPRTKKIEEKQPEIIREEKTEKIEKITDILEKYFMEGGIEMVERTYMDGDKIIAVKKEVHR